MERLTEHDVRLYYDEALTFCHGPHNNPGVTYYQGLRDGIYIALKCLGRLDLIGERDDDADE